MIAQKIGYGVMPFIFLFVGTWWQACQAEVISGTLTGEFGAVRNFIQQTNVQSTDASSNDDSASFRAILPFGDGSVVRASVAYDSDATLDGYYDYGSGVDRRYSTSGEIALEIDGYQFSSAGTTVTLENTLRSDGSAFFSVLATLDLSSFPTGFSFSPNPQVSPDYAQLAIQFGDYNGNTLDGITVPTGPLSVANLDYINGSFTIQNYSSPGTFTFDGMGSHTGNYHQVRQGFSSGVVSAASAVPEPGAIAALSLVSLFAFAHRRRKNVPV